MPFDPSSAVAEAPAFDAESAVPETSEFDPSSAVEEGSAELAADAERRYAAATTTAEFEGQGGPTISSLERFTAPAINITDPGIVRDVVRGAEFLSPVTALIKKGIEQTEVGAGAVEALEETAQAMTSPENLLFLKGMAGAPGLVAKGASAGFGALMASGVPESIEAFKEAKTVKEKAKAVVGGLANVGLAGLALGHAGGRIPKSAPALKEAVDRDLADVLSKSPEQVAAETVLPPEVPLKPSPATEATTPSTQTAPVAGELSLPKAERFSLSGADGVEREYIVTKNPTAGQIHPVSGKVEGDWRVTFMEDGMPTFHEDKVSFESAKANAQWYHDEGVKAGGVSKTPQPQTPKPNAPQEIIQQESVRPEPQGGTPLGEAAQASPRSGVQRPAEGGPEAVGSEGPGAAAASQFTPKELVTIANEPVNQRRVREGNLKLLNEQRQSNPETWAEAERRIEADPGYGSRLVNQLRDNSKESVTHIEEAALIHEAITVKNARDLAGERAADPNLSAEERASARQDWEAQEQRLNEVDQATKIAGTSAGRALQIRKMQIADDYTYAGMERRARAEKGDALSPEESTRIKEQAARIADLEKQLGEATTRDTDTAATKTSEQAHAELEREGRKGGKRAPKDVASIEKGLTDGLRAQAKEGNLPTDLRSYFQKLALNFIRAGTHGRDAVIDAVHGVVKDIFPGLERNQTRDIISGFGESKALDMEAAKVELRQIKQEAQQIAKIEKIEAREPIPKTGPQRQTPSDEGRALIKAVNEAKRKYGVVVTDPASQLKSAQDAISTRLKNQLRDMAKELETGEKPPGKTPLEYSAENKVLQALRDRVKETLDAIAEKPELTPEQRVRLTEKALERLQEHYEGMIRRGEHTVPRSAKPIPVSAKIEATRARIAELKEEIGLMRALDDGFQQAKEQTRLEQQGDALLQRLGEGEKPKGTKLEVKDTPEMAEQRLKNEAMRTALAEMKAASPEAKAKKLEAATKAVEASIAELDRQIKTGDVAMKAKPGAAEPPALERLKSERDAMRAYRDELRRALIPKKSPEAIALQAYKTRTLNRMAELQDRMARGDFAPKPRRELKLDKEATDLRFQIEKVKEQYNKDLLADRLAKRSVPAKVLGAIGQTLNTARAMITSIDLSAVLRQGGFIALGNPARAAKSIGPMLRAFASEKAAFKVNEEINSRPNADIYKKSKLYLADQNSGDLAKMEEAFMSRWAEKIPLVSGSARAYTTFLNKLRADSFDAMAASLSKSGAVTPDEAVAIANFINVATGRGKIGAGHQSAAALNTVFFSPRYVASRFQLLLGQPLYGKNARTRTLIEKEYGKFLAGAVVVYALGVAGGGKIETDPRSSDFGKIRFGDTRIDPLGGLLQATTLLTRTIGGTTKKADGTIVPIRGENVPFRGENTYDVMARFARTKFSPATSAVVNIATGKNVVGEKTTLTGEALNMVTPLSLKDLLPIMEAQGVPRGAALEVLSIFGFGLQHYEARQKP